MGARAVRPPAWYDRAGARSDRMRHGAAVRPGGGAVGVRAARQFLTTGTLTDDVFGKCVQLFGEEGTVESIICSCYSLTSFALNVAAVPLPEGVFPAGMGSEARRSALGDPVEERGRRPSAVSPHLGDVARGKPRMDRVVRVEGDAG